MATKKVASTKKKPVAKKPAATKQTSTKVTTLKAVESRPVAKTAAVSATRGRRFGLMNTPLTAALVAEFVGTFAFAAVLIAGQGQPILALFALAGIVLTVGTFSGGYVNPALVIGAWVTKRMSGVRAVAYIVAQVLGAMLALVVLNAFLSGVGAQTTNAYSAAPSLFKAAALPEGKEWFVFLAEFVGALIFSFAVAGALREKVERTAKAFTVGLGVFLGLMVAGSVAAFYSANAVLNPAVAISLQAISFDTVWPVVVYVLGPVLGAVAGFGLYSALESAQKDVA
jgi:aquaporin Z